MTHRAPLAGTRAVVTGASRGVGESIARALAGAGATVALVARGKEALDRIAGSLGRHGVSVPCDLSDSAAVAGVLASLPSRLEGVPTLLVNCAGVFPFAPLHELTDVQLSEAVAANLIAPFRFIRGLLPGMRAAGHGHIVTIGSVADRTVFAENGAYAATKFGARAMHEVLRLETRGSGVRATLVSPGPTDTAMWDLLDPDTRADLPNRDQMLHADDVARAVLFAVTQPPSVTIDELRLSRS